VLKLSILARVQFVNRNTPGDKGHIPHARPYNTLSTNGWHHKSSPQLPTIGAVFLTANDHWHIMHGKWPSSPRDYPSGDAPASSFWALGVGSKDFTHLRQLVGISTWDPHPGFINHLVHLLCAGMWSQVYSISILRIGSEEKKHV